MGEEGVREALAAPGDPVEPAGKGLACLGAGALIRAWGRRAAQGFPQTLLGWKSRSGAQLQLLRLGEGRRFLSLDDAAGPMIPGSGQSGVRDTHGEETLFQDAPPFKGLFHQHRSVGTLPLLCSSPPSPSLRNV